MCACVRVSVVLIFLHSLAISHVNSDRSPQALTPTSEHSLTDFHPPPTLTHTDTKTHTHTHTYTIKWID